MITEIIDKARDVLKYPRKVRSRAGEGNSQYDTGRRFHEALVESSVWFKRHFNSDKYLEKLVPKYSRQRTASLAERKAKRTEMISTCLMRDCGADLSLPKLR